MDHARMLATMIKIPRRVARTLLNYSDEERQQWLRIRALEWSALPSYIAQPVVPVLLIFYPWFYILAVLYGLGVLWCFVRYTYINVGLAHDARHFVWFLRWPSTLGCGIYLLHNGRILPGVIALAWPLIGVFTAIPGKVGIIERAFAAKLGFLMALGAPAPGQVNSGADSLTEPSAAMAPLGAAELTDEEYQECQAFVSLAIRVMNTPPSPGARGRWIMKKELIEPFKRALVAQCMMGRAEKFATQARSNPSEYGPKAREAAAKACSIHPLSAYFYDFASILEGLGDDESARDMFKEFLRRHDAGQENEVDRVALLQRDMAKMVLYANEVGKVDPAEYRRLVQKHFVNKRR